MPQGSPPDSATWPERADGYALVVAVCGAPGPEDSHQLPVHRTPSVRVRLSATGAVVAFIDNAELHELLAFVVERL